MNMEFDHIAQGHNATNTLGTHNIFFLDHETIKNIPTDRKITYACIIVDYRLQKPDPNRVRITVSRNVIKYSHE